MAKTSDRQVVNGVTYMNMDSEARNMVINLRGAELDTLENAGLAKRLADSTSAFLDKKYVNYMNGNLSDNDDYSTSPMIPVLPGDKLIVFGGGAGSQVAFYNSEESYVSGKVTGEDEYITVPETSSIRYMRWCGLMDKKPQFLIANVTSCVLSAELVRYINGMELIDPDAWTDGKYVSYINGNLDNNVDYSATGFIRVSPTDTLKIKGGTGSSQIAFYDKTYAYLSGYVTGTNEEILVPNDENVMYCRWCTETTSKSTASIKMNTLHYESQIVYDIIAQNNILNHADRSDGYYVDYRTGGMQPNSDYTASKFTRILPSVKLHITGGELGSQIAFYDKNISYVSGLITRDNDVVVVPDDPRIRYFKWCTTTENYGTAEIRPYISKSGNGMGMIIVSADGDGDFSSVTAAVESAASGDVIYVRKGVYDNEKIKAWDKNITIIGEDKYQTIIKNGFNDYSDPPLEMCIGSIRNLTLYQYDSGSEPGAIGYGYALHIESNNMTNGTFFAKDVVFKSDMYPGCGIGLRPGCLASFENCEFWSDENAGIFYHDCATGAVGVQKITFKNCTFMTESGPCSIRVHSQKWTGTTVYNTFINCAVANASGTIPVIEAEHAEHYTGDATEPIGDFYELINFFKGKLSSGNNVEGLNYVPN